MATGSTAQPKITQRLLLRTLILLIALGILFTGYRYFESQKSDFNLGSSNGAGIIAAIQKTDDGSEAVLIEPDGSLKRSSSYKAGASDRDPVWRPDGRFLFFASDRSGNSYHIFRWNPDQGDAEDRTVGSQGRTSPTFAAEDLQGANDQPLIISGGAVQELDPKTRQTPQLLPPMTSTITKNTSDDQMGGADALFQAMYGNLGTSFRYARYCKENRFIAAIMVRDGGEVLVLQDMIPKDGRLPAPLAIVGGNHIDIDVNPKDGSVVYSAQGFQWPDPVHVPEQFKKGNTVTVPYRHLVGIIDPDKGLQIPIIASKEDHDCFGRPAISPDGSRVLFTVGPYDRSTQTMTPKVLYSCPNHAGAANGGSRLLEGEVYEPSWSKDGALIAVAMRVNGKRDIYTLHGDGSSVVNVTAGKGDFSNPVFNPQLKQH